MRYSAAILVILGVMLGHSIGAATAQTDIFDLFKASQSDKASAAPQVNRKRPGTAERAPEEKTDRRRSTAITREKPGLPSKQAVKEAPELQKKCKKAKAIIEGFAFSNVEAKACDGNTYLFSAMRDNSTFSIKISSQTWELIDVSK
jgi:hypothetical protein